MLVLTTRQYYRIDFEVDLGPVFPFPLARMQSQHSYWYVEGKVEKKKFFSELVLVVFCV